MAESVNLEYEMLFITLRVTEYCRFSYYKNKGLMIDCEDRPISYKLKKKSRQWSTNRCKSSDNGPVHTVVLAVENNF